MKTLLTVTFIVPLAFLLLGSATNVIEEQTPLRITKAVVKTPRDNLPPVKQPVVIQIEHQGFPFDLNGNFPYVVLIDNKLYRCDKNDVKLFLESVIGSEPFVPGAPVGLN